LAIDEANRAFLETPMSAMAAASRTSLALALAGAVALAPGCGSGTTSNQGAEADGGVGDAYRADQRTSDDGPPVVADGPASGFDSGVPDATPDGAGDSSAGDAGSAVDAGRESSADASRADAADGGVCDPVLQTGCGAGQRCIVDPPACVANGTVATGQPCGSVSDDCVRGDLCAVSAGMATCSKFCATDSDCPGAAVASGSTPEPANVPRCTGLLQGTVTSTAYPLCTVACNPVKAAGPSGCLAHQLCVYTVTPSGVDTTDCQGSYAGIEGNACSASNDCDVGLVCVGRAQTHCRQVCRIGMSSDCTIAGDTCATPAGATAPMFGYCCPASGC
jgi:hypothetical protein